MFALSAQSFQQAKSIFEVLTNIPQKVSAPTFYLQNCSSLVFIYIYL